MKAWRFHQFNDMRLDDVAEPVCDPGHVLVEPLCVQPSVTEAQLAYGIPTLAFDRIKRRLETEAPIQLFGHEFCARVLYTGDGASRFRPGERVAARAKLPCGECPLCRTERSDLCRRGPVIGFDVPGCFAERACLPEIALVKVDDRISDSEAASAPRRTSSTRSGWSPPAVSAWQPPSRTSSQASSLSRERSRSLRTRARTRPSIRPRS